MTAEIIDFEQKRREHLAREHQELLNTDISKMTQEQFETYLARIQRLIDRSNNFYWDDV